MDESGDTILALYLGVEKKSMSILLIIICNCFESLLFFNNLI